MFWWLYTIIYCKNPFFGKPTNDFSPLQVCRMVPKNFEISPIEKYKFNVSAFQHTFERPSKTSRSKFIQFWNSKIPLLVSFPRMHHVKKHLQLSRTKTYNGTTLWSDAKSWKYVTNLNQLKCFAALKRSLNSCSRVSFPFITLMTTR